MRVKRWTWIGFAFAACIVSLSGAHSPLELMLAVAAGVCLFDISSSIMDYDNSDTYYPRLLLVLRAVCNVSALYACYRLFTKDNKHQSIVANYDDVVFAAVIVSRVFALFYALSRIGGQKIKHYTVVRTIFYVLLMLVVQVMAAIHASELAKLIRPGGNHTYASLHSTTTKKCELPAVNATNKGFLFSNSPFVASCPTRVWQHIRDNLLFASQVYVLYTITTDVGMSNDKSIYKVLRTVLAVIECVSLSAAAAIQFDTIEGSETLRVSVAVPIIIATVAYSVRQSQDSLIKNISTTFHKAYASKTACLAAQEKTYRFMYTPLKDVKLKL